MEKMEQASQPETWFDGNKVNDVLFCEDFLAGHPMKCIHGRFFDINGAVGDAEQIKAEIYYKIAPYVTSGIAKKGNNAPGCAADQVLLAAAAISDRPYPCGKRNLFPVGELLSTERILYEQASSEICARFAGAVTLACIP